MIWCILQKRFISNSQVEVVCKLFLSCCENSSSSYTAGTGIASIAKILGC